MPLKLSCFESDDVVRDEIQHLLCTLLKERKIAKYLVVIVKVAK